MKILLSTTLAFSLSAAALPALAEDVTAWRLFVSDHAEPTVTVIDPITGNELDSFTLTGPATLHRTESGKTVFATQGAAGIVNAISTGIAFEDHGDHGDIHVEAPRKLDTAFEGVKPAHFVERQGNIALFFDGEDTARFTTEEAVLEGNAETRSADVGAPHHGVAVPYGDFAVVTIPNPEDATKRPIGARVVEGADSQVGNAHDCPGLHGSAGSGSIYALACDTGLLLIRPGNSGAPSVEHLAYPASLPEGSASTLIGGKGMQYFIGNYGADRIVLIDPTDAEGFRLVQLPTRRVHFAVDPIRPNFAYVITEDGQLHQIDTVGGQIARSLKVTQPYSMDGHWSDPRPRLAVAGDDVVVTDPLNGKLHLIDAATFEKDGEIAVEGKPFNIVAVGGTARSHADE